MKGYTFEVRPCRETVDGDIEECLPEDSAFWGVYQRPIEPIDSSGFRPGDWVADFSTEAGAQTFAAAQRAKP